MTRQGQRPTARRLAAIEMAVYDHQYDWVLGEFGKEAAEKANYGWAVEELPDGVSVATKVYGHGVVTTLSVEVGVFDTDFQDF